MLVAAAAAVAAACSPPPSSASTYRLSPVGSQRPYVSTVTVMLACASWSLT